MTTPRSLWTSTTQPTGERVFTLARLASPREFVVWSALSAGLLLGGLGLLSVGFCLFGLFAGAVGSWGAWYLWRQWTRSEQWRLSPGAATRLLGHGGPQREEQLQVVNRLRLEADTDSDDRKLLRLFVVHSVGEAQVGQDWEDDERARSLAQAMADALGVRLEPPGTR